MPRSLIPLGPSLLVLALLVLAAIGAPGCQTHSVERAQQTFAEVKHVPFVPPPRTVDDVLALLDQEPASPWRERIAADRSRAEAPAPSGSKAHAALVDFYYRRGIAAQDSGRAAQQLADLARAVAVGREGPVGLRLFRPISALSIAEATVGRYSRHPALRQEAIEGTSDDGLRISWNGEFAIHLVAAGDLDGARARLARAAPLLSGMPRWESQAFVPSIRAGFLLHSGVVALASGGVAEAEGLLRQAIAEVDSGLDVPSAAGFGSIVDPHDAKLLRKRQAHMALAIALAAGGQLREAEVQARLAVRTAHGR